MEVRKIDWDLVGKGVQELLYLARPQTQTTLPPPDRERYQILYPTLYRLANLLLADDTDGQIARDIYWASVPRKEPKDIK